MTVLFAALPPLVAEAIATQVSVTITKVKCHDPCRNRGLEKAGESAADFYAVMNVNGVITTTPRGDEDSTEITPTDWKIETNIPNKQASFPVRIQIWDHDSTSGPDLGDATPAVGRNNLEFTVDRLTGQWSGDVKWPKKCVHGGNPGGEPAVEVCFEISGFEDADGDGLLDDWEKNGLDANSDGKIDVNLPAIVGVGPSHKDIFLELDWMTGQAPTRQAVQAVKAAFAAAPPNAGGTNNPDGQPGINLWVDTGSLTDATGSLVGDNLAGLGLGGGNAVPVSNISGLPDPPSPGAPPNPAPFYTVKQNSANFNTNRSLVFHYGLSAANPTNNVGTSTGSNSTTTLNDTSKTWVPNEWNRRSVAITGGTGRIDPTRNEDGAGANTCNDGADNGPDGAPDAADGDCIQPPRIVGSNTVTSLTVSLPWSITPNATSTYTISLAGGQGELGGNDFIEFNHDPGTIMHELGHNLKLDHGGDDPNNCEPNYVSVMNYDNQFGIQQNLQEALRARISTEMKSRRSLIIRHPWLRQLPVVVAPHRCRH